jgi:hypothetical protein
MAAKPTKLTIFVYNVGFGDCFLLRWHYPSGDRHVLIDFGSTDLPDGAAPGLMTAIAKDINAKAGNTPVAIVATHRHRDHISGFSRTKGGKGPGDIIAKMKIKRVVQPWTEHPKTKANSKSAPSVLAVAGPGAKSLSSAVTDASDAVGHEIARLLSTRLAPQVRGVLLDAKHQVVHSLKNQKMVDGLRALATQAGKKGGAYVSAGQSPGLGALLPGVKVTVLGPPTLEQVKKETLKYAPNTSPEYWLRLRSEMRASERVSRARGGVSGGDAPPYARWVVARLRAERAQTLKRIVTALDTYLNNTSVILLFEVGKHAILFPGDAQLENWTFAAKKFARKIPGVTLYKVGHHGSMNATPKSILWNRFTHTKGPGQPDRLVTILSSKEGTHGKVHEVPRKALVTELEKSSDLTSTLGASPDAKPQQVVVTF